MVHGLAAGAGCFDGYRKVFFDLLLSDEFAEALRAQLEFECGVVFDRGGGDEALAAVVQVRVFRSGHWRDSTSSNQAAATGFLDVEGRSRFLLRCCAARR